MCAGCLTEKKQKEKGFITKPFKMITMKKTIAVVGTGYWGKNLVRNFAELGALSVICDTDKDTLNHFKTKYPEILTTTSFQEVLEDEEAVQQLQTTNR